jgi:hypothetical protein
MASLRCRTCVVSAVVYAVAAGVSAADDTLPTQVVVVSGPEWMRHTIDDASRGADGVKLGDLNRDGLPDIVTGWEEGGVVRVCLNPGPKLAAERWPSVVVGRAKNVEEAIFADLDGDGRPEIVSGTEGGTKTVFRHRFEGTTNDDLLDSSRWMTEAIPATAGERMWMQAAAVDLDGRNGTDLVVGSKNRSAEIGWLEAPPKPAALAAWRHHSLRPAGWIMSIIPHDIDADGDSDVIFSDRVGERRGVAWLENPGSTANRTGNRWREHPIAAADRTVMFVDVGDVNADGLADVVAAAKPADIVVALQRASNRWEQHSITLDQRNLGDAKAVAIADLDGDGLTDFVFSCENAKGPREGIVWLRRQADGPWQQRTLGGPAGLKFDLMQVLDLDADGDLDVLACEERDQLGVVWYENPHPPRQ